MLAAQCSSPGCGSRWQRHRTFGPPGPVHHSRRPGVTSVVAAGGNGNGSSSGAVHTLHTEAANGSGVCGSAAGPPPLARNVADTADTGTASSAGVEGLRGELGELRTLVIAQARLVQSQQAHIQRLEATVGTAVAQQATALAAVGAVGSAVKRGSSNGSGLLLPPSAGGSAGAPQAAAAPALSSSSSSVSSAGVSAVLGGILAEEATSNAALLAAPVSDRRLTGLFDARYHSASFGATPRDHRILPRRIFLVRHAESEGNVDNQAYTTLPDPRVPLTARGWQQAMSAGERLRAAMDAASPDKPYSMYFYTSPYLRSRQASQRASTYEGLCQAFRPDQVQGVQEEVQLREQDFGNFQDMEGKKREKAERLRFGRFFYRFPNGESGADVYDRMTLFEDHLVRDINAGRFAGNTSLVLVTHGLAARIFLMRWFHWTVDQFMSVYNPPNAEPLVMERVASDWEARQDGPATWIHTKALYRLSAESREVIKGCTDDMCRTSWLPRGINPLDPADAPLL